MKLGVYVASKGNPLQLRGLLGQILAQGRKPDVVVIHENGSKAPSYQWVVNDLLMLMTTHDIDVDYVHTPGKLHNPLFYSMAIQRLYDMGCELFTKMDQDDIFFTNHLQVLEWWMDDHDVALNQQGHVCEMYPGEKVKFTKNAKWVWNPTGAPSDALIFNRAFAEALLSEYQHTLGTPDDVTIGSVMELPCWKIRRVQEESTMVYVSHGSNYSGSLIYNPLYKVQRTEDK